MFDLCSLYRQFFRLGSVYLVTRYNKIRGENPGFIKNHLKAGMKRVMVKIHLMISWR